MSDAVLTNLISLFDAAEERDDAGDAEGAVALYAEIIARAPEHPLAWHRRGMLQLFELEAPGDALANFEKARALGIVEYGIPHHELDYVTGEALFGLERYEEALDTLTRALSGNEDPVLVAEIHYRRAECADELDDADTLRRALTAFLELESDFVDSGGDVAWVEWAREQLGES